MGYSTKNYSTDKGNTLVIGGALKVKNSGIVSNGFVGAHFQVAAASAVAASNTGVHTGIILQVAGQTAPGNILTSPVVPRALRIKGNAAGIVGNVVITGTNYLDEVITETIVANGVAVVEGNKAFKTITEASIPARNAVADEIAIGWNDKLGLPYKLTHNTLINTFVDNTLEATAATVTVSATAIESNTIDPNTALSGKIVDAYFMI